MSRRTAISRRSTISRATHLHLVDIYVRPLRRIVVGVRDRVCTLKGTGIGSGNPRAAAIDEEVTDPDRGLDVVVALITTVGGDLVTVCIVADCVSVSTCIIDGDACGG